ncbi:MAG: hypothetical protein HQL54_12950 [Magnetococcales bacterium]|nr:hypothetical protein [Magnetococcales bacterium]
MTTPTKNANAKVAGTKATKQGSVRRSDAVKDGPESKLSQHGTKDNPISVVPEWEQQKIPKPKSEMDAAKKEFLAFTSEQLHVVLGFGRVNPTTTNWRRYPEFGVSNIDLRLSFSHKR